MSMRVKHTVPHKTKPLLSALQGGKTPRVPFWLMRQAGRYLPEYRALREEKGGFLELAFDPQAACEVTMQPLRRFGMDAAIIFSDILVVPYALGQDLRFEAGDGPKLSPVRNAHDLAMLGDRDFDRKLSPVYEALRNVRSAFTKEGFDDAALIGFAGAPWTVGTYMVEGGGSKDFSVIKALAYTDPELFQALIDLLVEQTAFYLIAQVDAGAEALQIFDSWAGALDEPGFQRWVIEPTAELIRRVRAAHPHVPIIGFPKGAGHFYLRYAEQTGISALGLDSQVPTDYAARVLQKLMPVQGNLDPMCLLAPKPVIERETRRILDGLSGGAFIFNLGHGINRHTPPENVAFLGQIIREHRRA